MNLDNMDSVNMNSVNMNSVNMDSVNMNITETVIEMYSRLNTNMPKAAQWLILWGLISIQIPTMAVGGLGGAQVGGSSTGSAKRCIHYFSSVSNVAISSQELQLEVGISDGEGQTHLDQKDQTHLINSATSYSPNSPGIFEKIRSLWSDYRQMIEERTRTAQNKKERKEEAIKNLRNRVITLFLGLKPLYNSTPSSSVDLRENISKIWREWANQDPNIFSLNTLIELGRELRAVYDKAKKEEDERQRLIKEDQRLAEQKAQEVSQREMKRTQELRVDVKDPLNSDQLFSLSTVVFESILGKQDPAILNWNGSKGSLIEMMNNPNIGLFLRKFVYIEMQFFRRVLGSENIDLSSRESHGDSLELGHESTKWDHRSEHREELKPRLETDLALIDHLLGSQRMPYLRDRNVFDHINRYRRIVRRINDYGYFSSVLESNDPVRNLTPLEQEQLVRAALRYPHIAALIQFTLIQSNKVDHSNVDHNVEMNSAIPVIGNGSLIVQRHKKNWLIFLNQYLHDYIKDPEDRERVGQTMNSFLQQENPISVNPFHLKLQSIFPPNLSGP